MPDASRVQGGCPMGCGETLFLGEGGHVTCSFRDCPSPTAVDDLLRAENSHVHIVRFDGEGRFAIQHTLGDRVLFGGDLFLCPLHTWLKDYVERFDRTPYGEGEYWARTSDAEVMGWEFEPV